MEAFEVPYDRIPTIFDKLIVTYNGEGDEGYVEEVLMEPRIDGVDIDDELEHDLRQLTYSVLEAHYGGWEINEGSQGSLTINVKERTCVLNHGTNRVETDYEVTELQTVQAEEW